MRSTTSKFAATVLAVAGLTAMTPSFALLGTNLATTSLGVSAVVLATCTVSSTPVAFGNYQMAQTDSTGSITVTCSAGLTAYDIGLDAGAGSGSTTTARKLTLSASTSTLNYGLYTDISRSINWGNTLGTTQSSTAVSGTATTKTFTVYGRVPAAQTSPAGNYADTVLVTVYY
jgi:spore coat protein U-like protein